MRVTVPASHHRDSIDHLHSYGRNDANKLEPSAGFDFEEVFRDLDGEEPAETTVSMADASAAISILLGWICGTMHDKPLNITSVGAKAESLLLLLDSNQSKYESLADIAAAAGITRQTLSKSLLSLKDQTGLALSIGKLAGTRQTYRATQIKSLEAGTHSSTTRKDLKSKRA